MWKRLLKWFRIAVTTASVLVCGLLIVLWVRSYFRYDVIIFRPTNELSIAVISIPGIAELTIQRPFDFIDWPLWWWGIHEPSYLEALSPNTRWSHEFTSDSGYWRIIIRAPYWFLVTITATIAALPWIKWRFSLRTLLVVMTLFALFFGMIAWSL